MLTVASLIARSAETTTFSIVGEFPSVVPRVARYCKYDAAGLVIVVPETAVHGDHVASGVAVLPLRVSNVAVVLVGRLSVAVSVFQVAPSSKWTREMKVHGVLNGPMRSQSTESELLSFVPS